MPNTLRLKKSIEHPSYENMIIAAVSNLKEHKGSSRPAIKKYVLGNYKVAPGAHFDAQISASIRRGVAKNVFSLPKGLSGTIKLVKPEKKIDISAKKIVASEKKVSSSAKRPDPVKKIDKSPVKKVVKKKAVAVKA